MIRTFFRCLSTKAKKLSHIPVHTQIKWINLGLRQIYNWQIFICWIFAYERSMNTVRWNLKSNSVHTKIKLIILGVEPIYKWQIKILWSFCLWQIYEFSKVKDALTYFCAQANPKNHSGADQINNGQN